MFYRRLIERPWDTMRRNIQVGGRGLVEIDDANNVDDKSALH